MSKRKKKKPLTKHEDDVRRGLRMPIWPDPDAGAEMRAKVDEIADDNGEEMLVADGFDEAIVAVTAGGSNTVVVYDWEMCVEILMRDMSEEDALEHMSYNVTGAYVGDYTPIFIRLL